SYYTHTTSSHPISSSFLSYSSAHLHALPSFPTRRSSDLFRQQHRTRRQIAPRVIRLFVANDARHADTIREAAGKQRRARRRADATVRVKILERHSLAAKAVDVRRANVLRPKRAVLAAPEIVGEDDENVRPAFRGSDSGCRPHQY